MKVLISFLLLSMAISALAVVAPTSKVWKKADLVKCGDAKNKTGCSDLETIDFTWIAPTLRENGAAIVSIESYKLYRGDALIAIIGGNLTTYRLEKVRKGTYSFQISTVEDGVEGAKSVPYNITVP